MTDRAKEFMDRVWECRNNGSDTEEKLVSSILSLAGDYVRTYNTQNGIIVLDRNNLIELSNEISTLSNEVTS